jgi:hypothetical protein
MEDSVLRHRPPNPYEVPMCQARRKGRPHSPLFLRCWIGVTTPADLPGPRMRRCACCCYPLNAGLGRPLRRDRASLSTNAQ